MSNLSDLLPAGAAAKQLTFTDSGSGIATKKPVILNSDGTVTQVGISSTSIAVGSSVDFVGTGGDVNNVSATYDTTNDKVVVVYTLESNGYGTAVVGTVSGTSTSWGTPVVFQSAATSYTDCCFDSGNGKVFIAYKYSNQGWGVVGTVSGTSISFGTAARFDGGGGGKANYIQAVYDSTLGVVVIGYYDYAANYSRASVNTISGTGFSTGTPVNIYSPSDIVLGAAYDSSAERVVFCYQNSGSEMRLVVGDVSGTTISFNGSEYNTGIQTNGNADVSYDPVQNKTLLYFNDSTANDGKVGSCTVTGDTITVGTLVANSGASEGNCRAVYNAASATHVLGWHTGSAGKARDATISGTSVTLSETTTDFYDDYIGSSPLGLTYDPDQKVSVFAFRGYITASGTYEADAVVYQSGYSETNLTAQAFVGVADSAISASAAGSVIVQGGTVTGVNSGQGFTVGTPSAFGGGVVINFPAMAYDTVHDKMVIAYTDQSNSSYGTAVVATISGSSISYGTKVVFESAGTEHIDVCFDPDQERVIIAYRDSPNSDYGTVIAGEVSGTSITFGSPVVYSTATTQNVNCVYDTSNDKVVIVYYDVSNTQLNAVVGTVSGSSISLGTPTTIVANNTSSGVKAVFDSTANKVVVVYCNVTNGDSDGVVGTVSGTSISFGSIVQFEAAIASPLTAAYDSSADKTLVVYGDAGNSDYGTSVVASVSGTSISFTSPSVFETSQPGVVKSVYDATAQQTVIAYQDYSASYIGVARAVSISGTTATFSGKTTLVDPNPAPFNLGYDPDNGKTIFAFYETTGQALVTSFGDLPLTTGTKYYVTTSGGFSSSAGDPSVNAGLAISTTSLLLNGDS